MNLALSLHYAAERTPQAEAVVHDGVRLTYAALRDRAARAAGALAADGVGSGDRVACVARSRWQTVCLYWACQWLGAVFVPLSHRISAAELEYCRDDSGAVAFFDARFELPQGDPIAGAFDLDEREPSLMLYTSGTTGRPKGVPRSHRADRAGGLSQVIQHGLAHGERTLGVMPLYHTMGMHSLIAVSLVGGCLVVQTDWEPGAAAELIERERIGALYLAPTLFHDLVWHERRPPRVRALAYAGSAMTGALVERCSEVLAPGLFVNHYGSTEIYTFSVQRDQRAKPGCAGRASLNAHLRLVAPGEGDPERVVAPGEDGEIVCHLASDEAFAGYWNRPDADEKAIRGGWYFTGDLGRLDEDGDLWVVGRVDDMVISGGENIHPLEVEEVLARHPRVREVAVVGAPDDRWGQRVVAVVVPEGELTAAELDAFALASETLARFKRPREYRFVDELPKSPSGKILRRVLRDGR
jgi:2-furoate---CoA ligase